MFRPPSYHLRAITLDSGGIESWSHLRFSTIAFVNAERTASSDAPLFRMSGRDRTKSATFARAFPLGSDRRASIPTMRCSPMGSATFAFALGREEDITIGGRGPFLCVARGAIENCQSSTSPASMAASRADMPRGERAWAGRGGLLVFFSVSTAAASSPSARAASALLRARSRFFLARFSWAGVSGDPEASTVFAEVVVPSTSLRGPFGSFWNAFPLLSSETSASSSDTFTESARARSRSSCVSNLGAMISWTVISSAALLSSARLGARIASTMASANAAISWGVAPS